MKPRKEKQRGLSLEIANISDVGKQRDHNEDSTCTDPGMGLLILADGIGGYEYGEIASAIVVSELHHKLSNIPEGRGAGLEGETETFHPKTLMLRKALEDINSLVYITSYLQKKDTRSKMGATVVCAWLHDDMMSIAHAGDSRMYCFLDDELEQITQDHSVIQAMRDKGKYSEEDILRSVPKNLVTRALGIRPTIKVSVAERSVKTDSTYLLCSDGLSDLVGDEEIRSILGKSGDSIQKRAEALVARANKEGGKDNISVILCRASEA